jgi:hypothetical protein
VVAGRAGAAGVTDRGFARFGFGVGAVTSTAGSCVLPDCAAVGAAALGAGVSPAAGAGAAAGASLPGVGSGDGTVCARAPAQSDEIRKDVEASNRGRNDTEAP